MYLYIYIYKVTSSPLQSSQPHSGAGKEPDIPVNHTARASLYLWNSRTIWSDFKSLQNLHEAQGRPAKKSALTF